MPFEHCFRFRRDDFKPTKAFPLRKTILRPVIKMKLIHGERSIDTIALIDSGADQCLFEADLGRAIGLDIESGFREGTMGVGSQVADVFYHDVDVQILEHRWKIRAGFIEKLSIGALAGREGFFSKFKVCLDQSRALTTVSG